MQKITFSKKLSIKFKISRKEAESLIKSKNVTLNGDIETRPFLSVTDKDIFEIGVHIADVSSYVEPETELDKEAKKRGTSVTEKKH